MNPLQHAYEASFEELLQLAYALAPEGGFIVTESGAIRRPSTMPGYAARACPLCAAFSELFTIQGAQFPASQLERQVRADGLSGDEFRYHGSVVLALSGRRSLGWAQFVDAADGYALTEEARERRALMREVLCSS